MRGGYSLLLMCLAAMLSMACRWDNTLYHSYQPVAEEWRQTDTLRFLLPRMERGEVCRMAVGVRYADNYPYRSLWLVVSHNLTDSTEILVDTLECMLTDKKGIPIGKGMSSLYQLEIPYNIIEADGSGTPIVTVTHCMRGEPLEGICDIGLHLYAVGDGK